ncbi:hypothetical protein DID77_02945 [Candidatus Marinamargulisbacteria bacterium SCGC AG-439-L15]|nr:hypothetical protein DID77_02945 [Candidatus Marinamargulisbacteria bacterium SCGC AG-439-L15]
MTEISSASHSNQVDPSRISTSQATEENGSFQSVYANSTQLQEAASSVFHSMLLLQDVDKNQEQVGRSESFQALSTLISNLRTTLGLSPEENTDSIQNHLQPLGLTTQNYAKSVHSFIFTLSKLDTVPSEKESEVSALLSQIQEALDNVRSETQSAHFF